MIKILNVSKSNNFFNIRRGFRAASNAAMDPKICHSLHQQGIASALGTKPLRNFCLPLV